MTSALMVERLRQDMVASHTRRRAWMNRPPGCVLRAEQAGKTGIPLEAVALFGRAPRLQ
jgi:hypothetical protein